MDKEKHLENIGERCYPGQSQKRTVDDHLARYNFVSRFIKDKIVLDIACGDGYGSEIMKKTGAKVVFGVDNDKSIIEQAKQKYKDINFVSSEATNTPFEDNYFDIVISFETWHHLDSYQDFIPEMHRILRLGGTLIISVPNEKVIYLNPFHRKFLTKFYRVDFNKKKIKKYLRDYFYIEQWYGQRYVKRIYLNFFVKCLLYFGQLISPVIRKKVDQVFKLADGSAVKPLLHDNSRYLIVLCKKKN